MWTTTLLVLMTTPQQAPKGREIRVVEGEPTKASIQALAANGTLKLGDSTTLDAKNWYAIRSTTTAVLREPYLVTTNGDRLVGKLLSADSERISFQYCGTGRDQVIALPFSALQFVWLIRPPVDVPAWLVEPRARDRFLTQRGDVRTGSLLIANRTDDVLCYEQDKKTQQVELSKLSLIAFNTDLARPRKIKGHYYRVALADGSRLTAPALEFDGRQWTATTLYKDKLRFPDSHVVAVDVEQGPSRWLATLMPTEFNYQSYLGEQRTWQTLPGEEGIRLPVASSIMYELDAGFRRFEAIISREPREGSGGRVAIEITVDGKVQPLPEKVEWPMQIRMSVKDAKTLKITVRAMSGGPVQNDLLLGDARLIP